MKQTIKTGLAALALLLAISCKKENSSMQTLSIEGSNSAQNGIIDDKVLAGNTVKIGHQTWMTANLRTKFYRNGDLIPQVADPTAWRALTTGAWCWYNNDSATYAQTYGKLYNWYAVNDPRGLAPQGWHIPSNAEWKKLTNYLGGVIVAGGKMKTTGTIEAGTGLWLDPNTDATNSSGFTGFPGGFRDDEFYSIGWGGFWWSSTEYTPNYPWYRYMTYASGGMGINMAGKALGMSVRCIKD